MIHFLSKLLWPIWIEKNKSSLNAKAMCCPSEMFANQKLLSRWSNGFPVQQQQQKQ